MIPILIYHEVETNKRKLVKRRRMGYSCTLSISQFEEQMNYLYKNNFCSLSLKELLEYDKDVSADNRKSVVITFDDGHIGNYKFAFPILKKFGFTATFFITTSWINKEYMMSWDQLKEMISKGMSVQSHTVSHFPLSTISDRQIKNELIESKKIIEGKLGNKVKFLSLPHGDFDSRLEIIAKQTGYKGIFTTEPKYFQKNNVRFFIGRMEIRKNYSINHFISIIERRNRLLKLSNLNSKIRFYLRSFIGINNYRRFYRLINRIELRD